MMPATKLRRLIRCCNDVTQSNQIELPRQEASAKSLATRKGGREVLAYMLHSHAPVNFNMKGSECVASATDITVTALLTVVSSRSAWGRVRPRSRAKR